MATPTATPTPPRRERTQTLVSMVNQVTLEGYLVRAWIHEPYRYLRLANQRPPERGGQTGGRVPVESDYVTVRLDPSVPFDMQARDARAAPAGARAHGGPGYPRDDRRDPLPLQGAHRSAARDRLHPGLPAVCPDLLHHPRVPVSPSSGGRTGGQAQGS